MSDSNLMRMLASCKYKYQTQVKKDIVNVFSFYHGLQPKLEKYTFPGGKDQELVTLNGTIPISFKGSTYHIPVCIFVQKDHPYSPPMCYVRPTPEMAIKASKYVDNEGKIYLPYLSDWKAESSDILGAIQVMIIIFGETPPVYQKPKTSPLEQQQSYNKPPYPTQTYSALPGPSATVALPPVSTSVASPSYSGGNPPYPTSYPYSSFPSADPPYALSNPSYPNYPSYPPSTGYNPQVNSQASTPSQNSRTITEEHIRASLITAVNDKIKERLRERLGRSYAENEVLGKYSEDLVRGKNKLESLMKRMENDKIELENCKKTLTLKSAQIDELIVKLENEQKVNAIDDAFGPQEPLYKQLLNAFAEENATVDAIYYLGEARRKGVIDLEAFLKNVRELSRRQFMLRALMQKCREKAGLPY
ncbi:tumor susceptibility gene 101 protein [Tetranychus urticae]|uniref:UEV domain-containing protein n=1 Tax=Tetranychus urticae TaxID=32264 RepID=T1KUB6_TETUR|nr:tumor susceptibility gene 101 protein [Tetranychus urticae]